MTKMGKKTLDIMLAEPLTAVPPELAEWNAALGATTARALLRVRQPRRAHRHRLADAAPERRSASRYKDLSTHQSSLEDIFVELVHRQREAAAMNGHGICRDLQVRDGALGPHPVAEPDHPGDHHLALFRGVRVGARQPHDGDGGGQLRRLHRPRADLAVGVHAVDLQRELRHLFSEVYGHDLRTSVSADLEFRGGPRLCRGGGDQVGDPGAGHPRHRAAVRAAAGRPSAVDAASSCSGSPPASACSASPSASGRRISSSCRSSRCW